MNGVKHEHSKVTAYAVTPLTTAQQIQRAGRYLRQLEFEPDLFKAQVGDWRDMNPSPAILPLEDGGSIPRVDFTKFTESDFDRISFKGTGFHEAIMPSVEFAKMLQAKGAVIHTFTVGERCYEALSTVVDAAPNVPTTTVEGAIPVPQAATSLSPDANQPQPDAEAIRAAKRAAALKEAELANQSRHRFKSAKHDERVRRAVEGGRGRG